MSEQTAETQELVELPPHGDAAFAALMDALAPEKDGSAAAPGTEPAQPAAGAGDPAAKPDQQTGTAAAPQAGGATTGPSAIPGGGSTPTPTAGDGTGAGDKPDAGTSAAAGTEPAGGTDTGPEAGDRPAAWTAESAELIPKLGELTTKIEEQMTQAYQAAALEEVQEEHKQYFEALQQHPRTMIGHTVPAIEREGMETLRSTDDAREWQEAVKHLLVEEVRDRATRAMEENAGFLDTITGSIELFTNNADLIPGTKQFDVDLANRFTTLATPYELRHEGKLQGYSIPVQPIIDQLRTQLTAERSRVAADSPPTTATREEAQPRAPQAAGAATPPATAPAAPPADQPQAGIQSKAGQSSEHEDFSVLFGTIGLPDLQI